ncbi:MAG: AAA family ATPase [Candidatus Tectomicrobia bacterium]|uniref:AAA family ATPase n=1 Tax=Tectimicrobiota bacterium TaxID=2528274 RepID=A0A933GPM7_UNCTE|nr:AAA family ATPase [Candidatus Tectomicrobia bacterium]
MTETNIKERLGTLIHPDEWLKLEAHAEPAIIENILPAQHGEYVLVSGRTGIGKSILMLNLFYCLGTGSPFFGFQCKKTRAGLLIMEGDKSNLRDRIQKVREKYPPTENIALNVSLETKPLEKNLDYYKETFDGCEVVMLDNLKQVTTSERLKNEYAATWITAFQKFLRDIGAVGILTHHVKKPNKNSLFEPGDVYELKGASEYVDDATTVILLERERQGRNDFGQFTPVKPDEVTLYFAKSRIADKTLEPINLVKNYETAGFDEVPN